MKKEMLTNTGWLMVLRRLLLTAAILALLCALCPAAWSGSEILSNADDPRLDAKIAFDADGIALHAALDQLTANTGVTMIAGLDNDDWSARDRKMIVHVTDMKLGDLMRQLSSTLNFHWSRGGDPGKFSYRLWQDKTERNEEESLRAAEDSTQSKQTREKRENALADMTNLGSLSAADAARLQATDAWRYVLATEPLGRDVADLMTSFPEARGAFVQGKEATFPVAELPLALQNTVKRIAESYDSLARSIGTTEDHADLLSRFEKLQITINRRTRLSEDIVSQSMLGRITIGSGANSFDIPLFDPASPVGKALGTAIISLKQGASKEAVGEQLQKDMTSAIKVSEAAQPAGRDITSDPALRAKYKLFDGTASSLLPVTLKLLAAKTKLNVISDYFPSPAPMIDGGERTLGEQLEVIRKAYGSNWTKSGNILVFRDKDWFSKRAWAVPEVWTKYWTDKGKLNNGLILEDLARIGDLRDEQIDHTIMADSQLVRFGAGEAARNRQILRFYMSLSADQRKQLSDSRLDAGSLSDDQWTVLKTALATKGAAYAAVQRGSQFIQLSQSGKAVIEYQFAYYPAETETAVTFKLSSGDVYRTPDEITLPKKLDKPQ